MFQKIDTGHRWLCQIGYDPRTDDPSSFTKERAEGWIRTSIFGPEDRRDEVSSRLDIDVIDVIPWVMSSTVAERFRRHCAFLIGDAAHQLPPSGGFGMNTAIQDAHNLAWKLAFVLRGRAHPSLLDTYHTERAPIARYNADRSLENTRNVGRIRKLVEGGGDPDEVAAAVAAAERYGNWLGMDLGLAYGAGCLLSDGTDAPSLDDPVSDYVDTARPGHRAPHVGEPNGRSTLDRYDRAVVLVAGGDLDNADLGQEGVLPADLLLHQLGRDETGVHELHEIATTGALLVRPDGHVAWRQPDRVRAEHIVTALEQLGLLP